MNDQIEIDADQIMIALARGGRMPEVADPKMKAALAAARGPLPELDEDVPILAD